MTEKRRALNLGMEGINIVSSGQMVHEHVDLATDPRKVLMYSSLRILDRSSVAKQIDPYQVLPFMRDRVVRVSSTDQPIPGRSFLGYFLNDGSKLMDLAEQEASARDSQVGARDFIIAAILDSRTDQPDQLRYWGANTDIVEELRSEQTARLYREAAIEGDFTIKYLTQEPQQD